MKTNIVVFIFCLFFVQHFIACTDDDNASNNYTTVQNNKTANSSNFSFNSSNNQNQNSTTNSNSNPNHESNGSSPNSTVNNGLQSCTPGEVTCVAAQNTAYHCNDTGTGHSNIENCGSNGGFCLNGVGCVICEPGTKACSENHKTVYICSEDGSGWGEHKQCNTDLGEVCQNGRCERICELSDRVLSYEGCEFWAIDLPNAHVTYNDVLSPRDAEFAVVVSNVHKDLPATVEIYVSDGSTEGRIKNAIIPPRSLQVFELGQRNIYGSGLSYVGFYIWSSIPVVAYQFNPLNNTDEAFSNDASMLIPAKSADLDYIITTYDAMKGTEDGQSQNVNWGAFVTILGISEQPTNVTVEMSTSLFDPPTGSGVTVTGNRINAIIDRYQALTITSKPDPNESGSNTVAGGGNLSGTRVSSDLPVLVWSGNVATIVPHNQNATCCADHLEEMMLPLSTWGREFVAAKSKIRRPSNPEPDFWRITASKDNTTFRYYPSKPTGAPDTLNSAQSVEFECATDFVVAADNPFMVTQFLSSSQQVVESNNSVDCNVSDANADEQCTSQLGFLATCASMGGLFGTQEVCVPISDPAMTIIPPIEQYRSDYIFLTPSDYAKDYANIIAFEGTEVVLDGNPVTDFNLVVDAQGYRILKATVPLTNGTHELTATNPVGLIIFGYDRDVSYSYPGGLNFQKLNATNP